MTIFVIRQAANDIVATYGSFGEAIVGLGLALTRPRARARAHMAFGSFREASASHPSAVLIHVI